MDSFIFKGKSSLEFENLVVCNIPPITKPPKRTEIIEIDGKDGNIINELGYKSYEKEVTLFRKGDIDVDKLAEWLNGSGKLIFSNEEDKYYNATIINQIDFPRFINYEYIKVIFQIQPFKYSNLDENIIFNCKSVLERCKIASINAAVGKLKNIKMYGELEQETKVSSNILKSFSAGETEYFASLANVYTSNTNYYKAEPLADSWIHVECDMTSVESSGNYFINHFIPPNKIPKLKTSTTYTIVYEFRNVDITKMSGNLNTLRTQGTTFDNYFSGSQFINGTYIQNYNNKMYKITKTTLSEFSGNIALRNFHTITSGDKFSYDYRISVLEGDKLSQDYTYEEYANRPSPEEEARITVIGDNINWFDKNNANYLEGYIDTSKVTSNSNYRTYYIPCLPNTTYTISRTGTSSIYVAEKSLLPTLNGSIVNIVQGTKKSATISTSSTAKYLLMQIYRNGYDNIDIVLNTTKIEKGTIQTNWTPYNCGGIDYKSVGKNIFNKKMEVGFINDDGSISYNANCIRTSDFVVVQPNTQYSLSNDLNYSQYVFEYDENYNLVLYEAKAKTTFTTQANTKYLKWRTSTGSIQNNLNAKFQLENKFVTEYEPYKEIVETITLPENEFMGKIDTYEDYIEGNILHKVIGKKILDGTENWLYYPGFVDTGGTGYCYQIIDETFALGTGLSKCSHFKNVSDSYMGKIGYIGSYCDHLKLTRKYFISDKSTLEEWKSWLAEQYANGTPVEIYYVLAEEYTVELDKFELPLLEGINNISSDAEIEAEYYNPKRISVNNIGLQKSLPIIKLKGEGTSSLYVNSIEQFIYNFPTKEDNSVIIDSIEQEAYYEGILKNRNMNGEFPELLPGINEVTWSGDVDEFEIDPKSRWL